MEVNKRGWFVIVLALFLLVFSSLVLAETTGCYYYPQGSEDLYCQKGVTDTEAQADCSSFQGDCNFNNYFKPNSDCKEVPACKQVTCSIDCLTHALGKCQQLNGEEVSEADKAFKCTLGCCKISNKFCQFGLFYGPCLQKAQELGQSTYDIFDNTVGMNAAQCNQKYCKVEVAPGGLEGYIFGAEKKLLGEVQITLMGTGQQTTTDGLGHYEFLNLNPGTYLMQVTKSGYLPSSLSVKVDSGSTLEKNFTLTKAEGAATLSGTIADQKGKPLSATISWKGPAEDVSSSDTQGAYEISNLIPGTYEITVSKMGFEPQKETVVLESGKEKILNFQLSLAAAEGVKGTVYIDLNGNGKPDTDEKRFDANLYLDGFFKGKSQYPEGNFFISYSPKINVEVHTLSASYQDFVSDSLNVTLKKGEVVSEVVILLKKYVGECSYGQPDQDKKVEQFTLSPLPGKKAVKLQWNKPCPEVSGYIVEKEEVEKKLVIPNWKTFSPADNSFEDEEVEWGQTYKYSLQAVYTDGEARFSKEVNVQEITLGAEICEGRYDYTLSQWRRFCLVDDSTTPEDERTLIWSCNDQNQKVAFQYCPTGSYYCAELPGGEVTCKDSSVCHSEGNPFGLYYQQDVCYGAENSNYCYFDYTNSLGDQCQSCTEIKSCFDYQSQDACEVNNCLGSKCQWLKGAANNLLIDYKLINLPGLVTEETGHGYCVEKDYKKDDQCSLCDSQATLFENYFCTPEICAGLGSCYSNSLLTSCKSCGKEPTKQSNCYSYATELECSGGVNGQGQNINKNEKQEFTFSQDRCDWGRCLWQGTNCVKDGDGNFQDDCAQFPVSEQLLCRQDNDAPQTLVLPEGLQVISLVKPALTFRAKDAQSPLGLVGFCLSDTETEDVCTNFEKVPYPGLKTEEEVLINLLDSSSLKQKLIKGNTYRLKFYSQDKYFNQEEVQQTFVYIDNVPPPFQINEEIQTVGDVTDLKLHLTETEEPMECEFTLKPVLPGGSVQKISRSRMEEKEVEVLGLKSIIVSLNVTCTDDHENIHSEEKSYTFDVEKRIEIVEPALYGAVKSIAIAFKIKTVSGATCSLYDAQTNQKISDFASENTIDELGKVHTTEPIPGFAQGEYVNKQKAVCQDWYDPNLVYEDYFQFVVDFLAPGVQVVLSEGGRKEYPTGFDWKAYFVRSAAVELQCAEEEGFPCDQIKYCLGEGCESLGSPDYRLYEEPFIVNESTRICYYAIDVAGNQPFQPECGDILIEGYGITLETPPAHVYNKEMWGISSQPIFDLLFYTKVPTAGCRFDFVSGFNYEEVPVVRQFLKQDGKYHFASFPGELAIPYAESGGVKVIYVQCQNEEGEIGPEQKINLEYDPTAPVIASAAATPNPVLEGIKTNLKVSTDDKTLCKYSDNSQGVGYTDYGLMEFNFPGATEKVLDLDHEDEFTFNFIGLRRNYSLNVQCANGAGNLSQSVQINFSVDYTQQGNIWSIWPSELFLNVGNLTAQVITTKNAICEYKTNDTYTNMAGAGGTTHTVQFSSLSEKKYQYPVKCTMGDQVREGLISFTIDRTPPVITTIEDGSYTCGKSELKVLVYTNEENLSGYSYQLYDLGNLSSQSYSSYSSFGNKTASLFGVDTVLVKEGTVGGGVPFLISEVKFVEGHKYGLEVKAGDAAGNWGKVKESDGILAVGSNYSSCQKDEEAPEAVSVANASCTGTAVEIYCQDGTNCQIKYGQQTVSTSCEASEDYNGQKIIFDQTGWLCYQVEDAHGNNYTGSKKITFVDEDGDGVADSCDLCPETDAEKIVDENGCANGELSAEGKKLDSDGDGLPDSWEKLYDAESCSLSYLSKDSNDNGVEDGMEDYDKDGAIDSEEYAAGTDPCVPGAPVKKGEVEEKKPAEALPPAEEINWLAWIFLLLGTLMFLGGTGYLIYYYRYAPKKKVEGGVLEGRKVTPGVTGAIKPAVSSVIKVWKQKLLQMREAREERLKSRERKEVFGEFGRESLTIPHVEEILQKKVPHLPKLQELAQKYVEHKEEIQPGLKPEEKSVFSQLEKIAQKTKKKEIEEVVSKEDAKDIFSKLKELSARRKKK